MPFVLCADFQLFPDNTQLGPSFTLAAMDFQDVPGGAMASFVNQTKGNLALQFPETGMEIDFPTSVPWARLRIGKFATDFTVEGIDVTGAQTTVFTMSQPNSYWNLHLYGPNLARVRFAGGDNEGCVVSVCIPVAA